jgi:hypothetical protein
LGENTIKKCLSESSYFENKTIGHLGLSKLQNIYRISFSGESCGVPTFDYYFGWNGKKFQPLPEKMNVGDADVFYHSEEFVFPSEKGGKANMIVKKIEQAELTIIEEFLPKQLSDAELTERIAAFIASVGATSPADMGKVMGAVKSQLAGKADMGLVSAAVKAALAP